MTAQGITELRLDYRDLASGQVMIVIDGFPAPGEKPLAEEARAVNEAAGCTSALVTSLVLAAWRGHEERATELAAAAIEDAEDMRRATAVAGHARAILCNGLGRYREALAAAQRACAHADLGSCAATLAELVEGAARAHAPGTAREALGRLEEQAEVGLRARSAALLAEGTRAEGLYRDAIEALAHGGTSAQLARARLVYGEWLRRERRRVDARKELRAAHETFSRIGAEAFAERALRELLATCETARKRTDDTRGLLTAQEAEIARLARDGLSNPEIGARLFISPRTVQYHLRKVFQKLSIRSRNQLGRIPSERLAA